MTSLAAERAEQARWRLRPQFADMDLFDRLVENEFLPEAAGAAAEAAALRATVAFAAAQVPYYRDLLAQLGITAADIRNRQDLPRLPVLGRRVLREQFERLKPERLPAGVEIAGVARSTGSTGPPTEVVHSTASNAMFSYLNQRQTRWFRRDPAGCVAVIRPPHAMPPLAGGRYLADGESLCLPRWAYVGTFFETGPSVYFSVFNRAEAQLAWLRSKRPDYLITRSHSLDHLVMAAGGEPPCPSLRAMTAISEPITAATRRYLERAFGAPVQQGYGLNEIGLVAVRCEAGRYHVHREHCVVEIVDQAGAACRHGEAGRLLVTALQNAAMPLLRYDSDDLATAVAGPCACGCTLPAFGEILGRLSRITVLPAATLPLVDALRAALQAMPASERGPLRRYQIHQSRSGAFELRIVAAAAMPPDFRDRILRAWAEAAAPAGPPLTVREVSEIPLFTAGDKFEDFVSEFAAAPARAGDAGPH